MPFYKYRKTLNTFQYLKELNRRLPPSEQIESINVARQERISIDAPSGAKDDLDELMALLGYEPNGAGADLQPTTHHGKFAAADAITTNVDEGDSAYCTDGNLGVGAPVYYDGTDWRVVSTDSIISAASTGGVAFAGIFNGGSFIGATDGDYTATQASTSGAGTGAEFTVTVASNAVTAIVSVDSGGTGYAPGDTINLTVTGTGGTQFTDPVLTVIGIS